VVGLALLAIGCFLSVEPITYYLDVRRVEDTEIYRLVTIMVLFVTGINVMVFGAFANHILEIVRGKTLAQSSLLGKYVLNRRTIGRSGLLGTILMVGAVSLNYQALYEYITSGYIFVHWVYVLTGATLFLVGLQLLMGSILIGILQEINERQKFGAS
jgi:hypothetical protein